MRGAAQKQDALRSTVETMTNRIKEACKNIIFVLLLIFYVLVGLHFTRLT